MPTGVRRLRRRELPPIDPLREVTSLWGPVHRSTVATSSYWSAARATARAAEHAGRDTLSIALRDFAAAYPDIDLRFGAWHGDWVEWNLGRVGTRVIAWDWAYSASGQPIGFDLLQFFHLRYRNLRRADAATALTQAALDAGPGLDALGLAPTEREAVVALHRIEVTLRSERAQQARSADIPRLREPT